MFVAIKGNNTTYVGASSAADSLCDMNQKDMLLDENVLIWKIAGHKGWYAVGGRCYADAILCQGAEDAVVHTDDTHHTQTLHSDERRIVDARDTFDGLGVIHQFLAYDFDVSAHPGKCI